MLPLDHSVEARALLIDEPIVCTIVDYTNIKITEQRLKFGSTARYTEWKGNKCHYCN